MALSISSTEQVSTTQVDFKRSENERTKDLTTRVNEVCSSEKGWKIAKPVLIAAIVAGLVIGALAALYFTGAINWLAQQGVLNPQVTMITTLVGVGVALVATSVLVTKAICECRNPKPVKPNLERESLLRDQV